MIFHNFLMFCQNCSSSFFSLCENMFTHYNKQFTNESNNSIRKCLFCGLIIYFLLFGTTTNILANFLPSSYLHIFPFIFLVRNEQKNCLRLFKCSKSSVLITVLTKVVGINFMKYLSNILYSH